MLGAASRDEIAEFVSAVVERALADRSESGAPLVAFACALWHEETVALKPDYRAAAVQSYKAETHHADFFNKAEEAREEINQWVSKATKDLMTSILPPDSVDSNTALVLATAIYFKGRWSMPFANKDTETRRFQRLDGSPVRTIFMDGQGNHAVAEYDGFKVLKLAYHPYRLPHWQDKYLGGRDRNAMQQDSEERSRFSMCVFLPDDHDGLPSLVDEMASCPSFLWDHMLSKRVMVGELWLPKFKLSFSSRINDILKAMGIKAAFGEGTADLSDMLEARAGIVLEHVFHKAVIEVNQLGTETAASTACMVALKCCRYPVDFVADHPFAFFVVEEVTGVVFFMAHILDPTKSA
ncbi:serpin-Z2A-like [Panicum virgatum]|uniref:serpin-Z2A-like n=1 Tax=Panicum virgatum TaxID=38727 RepID=UPI0019D65D8D|nr:serpin-Z2A-like [Panicum virgatum]